MKMHPANDSERPRGPADLAPRCSFARLILFFAVLFSTGHLARPDLPAGHFPDIGSGGQRLLFLTRTEIFRLSFLSKQWFRRRHHFELVAHRYDGGSEKVDHSRRWRRRWCPHSGGRETLIVFASGKNRTTDPLATNFLLPCASTGYLYNPQATLISQKGGFQ